MNTILAVRAVDRWGCRRQRFGRIAGVMLLMWLAAAGQAVAQQAETLQSLSFASLPGDGLEVRLDFDAPPPESDGFVQDQPARVSIDLPGVGSALGQREFPIAANNASSLMVLETSDRTRLVFNLEQPMNYTTAVEDNTLVVRLGRQQVADQDADSETPAPQNASSEEEPEAVAPEPAQPSSVSDEPSVTDFRFQSGEERGEAHMTVELSSADITGRAERQGRQVVVEFSGVEVPEHLNRRFDVRDFSTPVDSVDLLPERGNASLVVDAAENFEYVAWQEGREYNISVQPVEVGPQGEDPAEQYSGTDMSLSFQDVEIRSVLQILADEHDFNLVVSDAVSGGVTLHLEEVPWDQALDLVLQSRNLDKRLTGNVLYVAPASEIAAQQQLALEAERQAEALAPLQTEYVQVNYADARNILQLLTGSPEGNAPSGGGSGGGDDGGAATSSGVEGMQQVQQGGAGQQQNQDEAPEAAGGSDSGARGILSSRGTATVDPRTNIIIIRDVASKLEEVRELLGRLDVPVRQVLIEARIVNVSTDFGRDLGVRWGAAGHAGGSNNFHYGGSLDSALEQNNNEVDREIARRNANQAGEDARLDAIQDGTDPSLIDDLVNQARNSVDIPTGSVSFPEALAVDLGVEDDDASSFSIGFARNSNLIELELSALESSGNGEVIARPKVTTQDKVTADIQSGVRVPFQAQAGGTAGGSTTEFVDAVLSLEVTPQITPDGRIIMQLNITQDSVQQSAGQQVPAINTNSINTSVLVDNGDTVVLGGIFREETSTSVSKTPLLGDVPYLGNLFKRTNSSSRRTELLIFITPRIIAELGSA